MKAADPTHEIIKGYYDLIKTGITYGGNTIYVGTKIPQNNTTYVYIYLESLENKSTADSVVYLATVTMQIVSMQDADEGNDTVVNSILEQLLTKLGDPALIVMTHFKCLTAIYGDMETLNEMDESKNIITKKLRMTSFVEQLN